MATLSWSPDTGVVVQTQSDFRARRQGNIRFNMTSVRLEFDIILMSTSLVFKGLFQCFYMALPNSQFYLQQQTKKKTNCFFVVQ